MCVCAFQLYFNIFVVFKRSNSPRVTTTTTTTVVSMHNGSLKSLHFNQQHSSSCETT